MKYSHYLRFITIIGIGSQLIVSCATFSGAESAQNLNKLKYGMHESEVLNLLGTPDTVVNPKGDHTRWVYEFKKDEKKGHNIFIDFRNGALAKTGELNGRDLAASDENRYNGSCTKNVNREVFEESRCLK